MPVVVTSRLCLIIRFYLNVTVLGKRDSRLIDFIATMSCVFKTSYAMYKVSLLGPRKGDNMKIKISQQIIHSQPVFKYLIEMIDK